MSLSFDEWFESVEGQILAEMENAEKRGEKKGLKAGEKIGLKAGEAKTQLANATNFLKLGVDIETVSKGVGMDINKVRELAVELGLATK